MNKNGHEHLPRFSAVGVATASILALIVAMALSVVFDSQPAEASTATKLAHTVSAHADRSRQDADPVASAKNAETDLSER
jgi:hypothetical protein